MLLSGRFVPGRVCCLLVGKGKGMGKGSRVVLSLVAALESIVFLEQIECMLLQVELIAET